MFLLSYLIKWSHWFYFLLFSLLGFLGILLHNLKNKIILSLLFQYLYNSFNFLTASAAAAAKSLQSCPTLCDPTDCSLPGSSVPGILQARTLEWVAISFSNAWEWKVKVKSLSHVLLLATPWTAAYQVPPSTGVSRQEYWSGVPLPSPMASARTSKIMSNTSTDRDHSYPVCHEWKDMFTRMFLNTVTI